MGPRTRAEARARDASTNTSTDSACPLHAAVPAPLSAPTANSTRTACLCHCHRTSPYALDARRRRWRSCFHLFLSCCRRCRASATSSTSSSSSCGCCSARAQCPTDAETDASRPSCWSASWGSVRSRWCGARRWAQRRWRLVRSAALCAELSRTLLVGCVAALLSAPMLVVQTTLKDRALALERAPRPDRNALVGPLPDVLLDRWPARAPDAPKLCDALWFVLFFATLLLALTRRRRAAFVIVRRAMLQTGALYFLRGLTVGLTVLPRADPTCINQSYESFAELARDMAASMKNFFAVCYDFLFSGHTATATLLGAVWPLHAPWLAGRLFGPSLAAAVVFLISYERLHYTVDIVLALIIAALVLALHHVLLALGRLLPPDALPPACCRRRRPHQSSSVECAGGDASVPFKPRIRVGTVVAFALRAVRWVDGADLLERRRAPHCPFSPTVSASAAASAAPSETAAAVAVASSAAARPSPLPLPHALTSSAAVSLHRRAPSCPVGATGATTAMPTLANTHTAAIIINSTPICTVAVPTTSPADGAHTDAALAAYEYTYSNGESAKLPSGNEHADERPARWAQAELPVVQGITYPTVAFPLCHSHSNSCVLSIRSSADALDRSDAPSVSSAAGIENTAAAFGEAISRESIPAGCVATSSSRPHILFATRTLVSGFSATSTDLARASSPLGISCHQNVGPDTAIQRQQELVASSGSVSLTPSAVFKRQSAEELV